MLSPRACSTKRPCRLAVPFTKPCDARDLASGRERAVEGERDGNRVIAWPREWSKSWTKRACPSFLATISSSHTSHPLHLPLFASLLPSALRIAEKQPTPHKRLDPRSEPCKSRQRLVQHHITTPSLLRTGSRHHQRSISTRQPHHAAAAASTNVPLRLAYHSRNHATDRAGRRRPQVEVRYGRRRQHICSPNSD